MCNNVCIGYFCGNFTIFSSIISYIKKIESSRISKKIESLSFAERYIGGITLCRKYLWKQCISMLKIIFHFLTVPIRSERTACEENKANLSVSDICFSERIVERLNSLNG